METGRILEGASLRPPESPRVLLFTNFTTRLSLIQSVCDGDNVLAAHGLPLLLAR